MVNGLYKKTTNLVSEPKLRIEQFIAIQLLRDLLDIKNNACTLDNLKKNIYFTNAEQEYKS